MLTHKVRANRGSLRQCDHCEGRTIKRKPTPLRKSRPLGWKRAEAKATGDVQPEEKAAILAFYRYMCGYCEQRQAKQWDHWVPIAKGGRETASNLIPSCVECNAEKGTSLHWEPKRKHPFMVKAQAEARALALKESFETAGLDMGGER